MSDVTLKEYTDRQIAALEKTLGARIGALQRAVDVAHQSARDALEKADRSNQHRLAILNDSKTTIESYVNKLLPREESNIWRSAIEANIHAVTSRVDRIEARGGGMRDFWGWIVAAVAVVGMLWTLADKWGT